MDGLPRATPQGFRKSKSRSPSFVRLPRLCAPSALELKSPPYGLAEVLPRSAMRSRLVLDVSLASCWRPATKPDLRRRWRVSNAADAAYRSVNPPGGPVITENSATGGRLPIGSRRFGGADGEGG